MVGSVGWRQKFQVPIELPDGRKLFSLRDAIDYLSETVPIDERQNRKVLIAAASLNNAADGRDLIVKARTATLEAIHRNV